MIHTITLNPAIDKILSIGNFQPNCTNRIRKVRLCLGGKGSHIAYGLSLLGVRNRAYGIAFGHVGRQIMEALESAGIEVAYDHYNSPESRTNYLLIDAQNNATFLAEAGVSLTEEMTDHLFRRMEEGTDWGDAVAVAGDASNAKDGNIHQKLLEIVKRRRLKLYLDSSGEFLRKGIACRPYLIKPNLDELAELARRPVSSQEEVLEAISAFPEIPYILVSMGARGWIFRGGGKRYRGFGLKVPVGNTAGCGDALMSALLCRFEHTEEPLLDTLAFATAVSAACAMCAETVGFDVEQAKRMQGDVVIQEI
ncbi:MAG: PfkB family carbohydrate kinase [Clostridia bacterium]|nr:PfkB family carbohydrate kinase [Clostridia bacterium]